MSSGAGGAGGGAFEALGGAEGEKYPGPAGAKLYRFAGVISEITDLIRAKGTDLASAIGRIVDKFAPGVGSVISALGGLFGKLFGKKKEPIEVKQVEPWVIAPEKLSVGLGAAPAGMVYSGRFAPTGAGFMVDVSMNDGVEEFIDIKVANRLNDLVRSEGLR